MGDGQTLPTAHSFITEYFEVSHILYVCVFVYGEPTDQRRHASATPRREPPVKEVRAGLARARGALHSRPCGALVPSTADRRCFRSASAAHRVSSSRRALLVFEQRESARRSY